MATERDSEKLFWPEDGLTKTDMLRYYEQVAPALLAHCRGRPVTLHVFPDGISGTSFYRRDLPENAPTWMRSVDYQPETTGRTIQLPLIHSRAGLLWFAGEGSIEFHLWPCRRPRLDRPDQAIFDLDPGEGATFADVRRAALHLRGALEQLGLRSYPKTSGGRGLHVYLPLARRYTFDVVRAWVKALAEQLAASHPRLVAVAHGATHKGRQVTIDHAQNSVGRNTAAPYTLRAYRAAPVSTPLTWDEVEVGRLVPADLTLRTVPERLQRRGDLFAGALEANQYLPRLGPAR